MSKSVAQVQRSATSQYRIRRQLQQSYKFFTRSGKQAREKPDTLFTSKHKRMVQKLTFGERCWLIVAAEQATSDKHTLDLICAFVDLSDFGIAHQAFGGIVLHISIAAQDLNGIICNRDSGI